MRCPNCGRTFQTLEDEQQFDYCPYCGFRREDLEPQEPDEDVLQEFIDNAAPWWWN